MTTYFEAGLSAREFGTDLLSAADLLAWAKAKRLHLRTDPPIDGFEFVHIETLLCAIERHAAGLTHDQAKLVVQNDAQLQARIFDGMAIERDEFNNYMQEAPCWLVQADAHLQWRKTLAAAISTGELEPLQFGSKLPAQAPATPEAALPATETKPAAPATKPATPEAAAPALPTKDIAECFDGLNGWNAKTWPKRLSGSAWLHPARVSLGGQGGASSLWDPLTLAQLVCEKTKDVRTKQKILKSFNCRFNKNPVLEPWKTAFNDYFAMFSESD